MFKFSNKTPSPIRHQARFVLDSSSFSKGYNEYNGLKDPYLEGFFASERRKKLLLAQNLINQKGKINDGICKKKILDISLSRLTKKKSMKAHSTNGSTSVTKRTFKKEENEVQPMSSEQFKKLIEDFRKQNGIENNKHLFITNHE
ncbi:unnamed protein product [Blepharisma stoltei]|uniref:Uncharacterized protein n=1 Tax=Blepharisma stoltei TaxID=1481888 RepID=A0AAU9IWF5_9CILI|nr:unnamed protein product [Blepharisma stoltei]